MSNNDKVKSAFTAFLVKNLIPITLLVTHAAAFFLGVICF